MTKPMNVFKSDIEESCFCCGELTRLVLIEAAFTYPLCDDCLLTLSSIEYINDRKVVNC